jgi:hypothetical protein
VIMSHKSTVCQGGTGHMQPKSTIKCRAYDRHFDQKRREDRYVVDSGEAGCAPTCLILALADRAAQERSEQEIID